MVALTEVKVLCVQLLHRSASQLVHAGEHPAAATALLVGNARVLNLDAEVLVLGTGILLVDGHLRDADIADGIAERLLGGCTGIAALELLEHFGRDARLCACQHAEHHCQCVDNRFLHGCILVFNYFECKDTTFFSNFQIFWQLFCKAK